MKCELIIGRTWSDVETGDASAMSYRYGKSGNISGYFYWIFLSVYP